MLDVLFVHPGGSQVIYQELSQRFSAIETPTWSLLLAQSCRVQGFGVAIMDCDAERLSNEAALKRIEDLKPRLVCFVVYGSNPNAGTTKMVGAVELAGAIRTAQLPPKICFVGSHASALPEEVLGHDSVDFVLLNEGVYAIQNLLRSDLRTNLQNVKGIGWKQQGAPVINAYEKVVPSARMDIDLPGSAWDLLPYREKPFDLYRSCNWHADFKDELRNPYAAIYTSLGCRFKCDFCMINILNRVAGGEVSAADSAVMRFWSPEFMIEEFAKLIELYGVTTIRISDEMFMLDRRYFEPLCKLLVERGYGDKLRIWVYARVDTVRERFLELFRKAGITWVALGVESTDTAIRREVTKGTYEETDIRAVIGDIGKHDISVIANYIFGLPDDTLATMNHTLDTAIELNTEMANFYCAASLPGSPLYWEAKKNRWEMPSNYAAWSFHSYDTLPLPTKYLTAAQVLRFRDDAWRQYFSREEYLAKVENKFGSAARQHVEEMAKIKLRRRLLEECPA